MALTAAQMVDVRRFMGYQVAGTTVTIGPMYDVVYGSFGMVTMSLYTRLTSLSAEEEAILINVYLSALTTLEAAIVASGANLDTDSAAIWTHNKSEVADRSKLFDSWRLRLCGFIGFKPGAGIGSSVNAKLAR
jgi:hypothetical protein